ncbi:MAG: 4-(cytidine 5'-diphospho)-2-C-methyl-D-erythritol kinase [Armatimonadota bacterium]|nr:4-(cytidine 5'-diphospho)-2-C-methyl-D-erythritol kinase [Armatimonadota bacterium]MDR7403318.1 4-(cytidine 5'-diphospho)-2-C-methyl-D-erythritol kinase [Armatimonadota bacterium]
MKELRLHAYAKINLTLDVLGERSDGYHDVETVLHTIALHDVLILREAGEGVDVVVHDGDVPSDHRNLVVRAAQLVRETFRVDRGVQIELIKRIPAAAGLGGGSADAAVTLLGLAQMWKLRLDGRALSALAVRLGSDVLFFLEGGAALARGRGEILEPLPPLPSTWVVLGRPQIPVATEWAYRQLRAAAVTARPDTRAMVEALRQEDVRRVGRLLCNVFEDVVGPAYPVIREIKRIILSGEAYGAALSGTGPTVYGLMANEAAARKVADDLAAVPDVDVIVTRTFAEAR